MMLQECDGLEDLQRYYPPGTSITLNSDGFVVRLPKIKRIAFYRPSDSREFYTKPFVLASVGYYDQYSPFWIEN